MSDDSSQRLDELKLLWESDPSSKVYLQLATAYRQKGQLDKAIEVLETSLQHRPRDPRGRVALARCKMEKSDFAAAAELLEEVIRQDAAHVEANKQLLECYLLLGDAEKAEERLGIYKLLNDRDPELDHLEYRLQSLAEGEAELEQETAAPSEPGPSEPTPSEPTPSEPIPPQPAHDEAAATQEVPIGRPPEPQEIQEPPHEAAADPVASVEDDEHRPIPGLPAMKFAVGEDQETELETVPEENRVAADVAVEPPPPVAEVAPPVAMPVAPESPEPEVEVAPPAGDELFELAPEPAADADSDPWGGDLFDLASPIADEQVDDLDGLWEQTEVVELDDEEDPGVAVSMPDSGVAAEEGAEDEGPAATDESDDEGADETATATLGLLYLRQGHLDEAERIFRRVLEADAENEAALAGMQQLEAQRAMERAAESAELEATPVPAAPVPAAPVPAAPVPAAPVPAAPDPVAPEVPAPEATFAEAPVPEPAPEPEPVGVAEAEAESSTDGGLTAEILLGRHALEGGGVPGDATGRKIAVLQQYIQHIRAASRNHVH